MRFRSPQKREKTEEEKQINALMMTLAYGKETEQKDAKQTLLDMGPDGLQALITRHEALYRSKAQFWKVIWKNGSYLVLFCLMISWFLGRMMATSTPIWYVLFPLVVLFYLVLLFKSMWTKEWNSSSRLLTKFDDVRVVGPLIQALEFGNSETQEAAIEALVCLLPRMQASDAEHLAGEQYGCLLKALLRQRKDLKLAILKALEQIGDEAAIENVTLLTRFRDADIQNAASACLPFLRQRGEQAKIRQTLLRPSQVSGSPDTLLRPAAATEAASEQLLRPHNAEN